LTIRQELILTLLPAPFENVVRHHFLIHSSASDTFT
jgi:hypothetical protein